MTPESIGPAEWNSLTALLVTIWLFATTTVVFTVSFVLGHAVLPSLQYTGDLPPRVVRLRPLLYLVALVALGIDVLLFLRLGVQLGIIGQIYQRFLI